MKDIILKSTRIILSKDNLLFFKHLYMKPTNYFFIIVIILLSSCMHNNSSNKNENLLEKFDKNIYHSYDLYWSSTFQLHMEYLNIAESIEDSILSKQKTETIEKKAKILYSCFNQIVKTSNLIGEIKKEILNDNSKSAETMIQNLRIECIKVFKILSNTVEREYLNEIMAYGDFNDIKISDFNNLHKQDKIYQILFLSTLQLQLINFYMFISFFAFS